MAIVIRPCQSDADLQAAYAVRFAVFVEEQKVPQEEELDSHDAEAQHFVVEDDGRIVGTARLVELDPQTGKIGRVALLPPYRNQGIGRDLMWYTMAASFRRYSTIVLDAQLDSIPFYERLGFEAEGPVFMDAGIEHRRMRMER